VHEQRRFHAPVERAVARLYEARHFTADVGSNHPPRRRQGRQRVFVRARWIQRNEVRHATIRPVSKGRLFAGCVYGKADIEAISPEDVPDVVEAAQIKARKMMAKTT